MGRAVGRGAETELRFEPAAYLELFTNAAYNYTEIRSFPQIPSQVGLPLNQAPRWNGAAGATVRTSALVPGELSFSADMSFRSRFRTANAVVPLVAGYTMFNVRLSYTDSSGRDGATLFADNLFNKFTYSAANAPGLFLTPVASRSVLGDPRTVGVDFRMSF